MLVVARVNCATSDCISALTQGSHLVLLQYQHRIHDGYLGKWITCVCESLKTSVTHGNNITMAQMQIKDQLFVLLQAQLHRAV